MDRDSRIIRTIAEEISAKEAQVAAAIKLLDEGATVPFIARYRKEATGGLDDTQLRLLAERLIYLRELDTRRDAILKSITEQDKLTPELTRAIEAAATKTELEDIYLPYKPKRRTKAVIAREKGLEPLRDAIMTNRGKNPADLAAAFVTGEVADIEDALSGARDILTEELTETPDLVGDLRGFLHKQAAVTTKVIKGKEAEGEKFADYFEHAEPWSKMAPHRALAMLRAVNEGIIRFDIAPQDDQAKARCETMVASRLKPVGSGPGDAWLRDVATHAWKTRLSTTMTTDLLAHLRQRAHEEAITVFARNLKDLLLAAPAGARPTIGLDPGIRTGVKVAVVDATGKLLDTATIYPFQPRLDVRGAQETLVKLMRKHAVELIAIGNGTGSRETDKLVGETLKLMPQGGPKPIKVMVSEAGASVYSASELAAKEFPTLDVSLRGAVSIARRLQDPLSELVKIEPNAIGVGQYQHDVDQKRLAQALTAVVEDAVNAVGVDLNTASAALLSHVSGLTPTLAASIVAHRDANGPFKTRRELLKVKGLGPKAFEQCAGFLRIRDGKEPLDASSVHPEAYDLARKIVIAAGRDLRAIQSDPSALARIKPETFVSDTFGLPTVRDIFKEIEKPGRDPRPSFKTASFASGVEEISDLRPGMALEGTVTNVATFGAFVDIGVHQDGLVHVSQLADRFVKDPSEIVKAGDVVKVRVTEVDPARKRISLTMRQEAPASDAPAKGLRGARPAKGRRPQPKQSQKLTRNDRAQGSGNQTGALGAALLQAMKKK